MKNVVIIGASSGIGNALAEKLVQLGNKVTGTYNTTEPQSTNGVNYSHWDANKDSDFSFLPDTIDSLVYCPGTINLLPFHRIKLEDFAEDFNVQVLGAIRVIQAALPALKKSSEASVLLFSTVAVQSGFNFHSQVATSKGAIEGLTKALAAEFAPTIRVNAIAPSLTDTKLASKLLNTDQKREANAQRHPLKRIGTASDIAEAAAFLLSNEASWITGQILSVDGGMSTIKL